MYRIANVKYARGETFHSRKGCKKNSFSYSMDLLVVKLFRANTTPTTKVNTFSGIIKFNLEKHSFGDIFLRAKRLGADEITLITQPEILGQVFNPVSFWIMKKENEVVGMVSEVNNTFGSRTLYEVCNMSDGLFKKGKVLRKSMRVSPFQTNEGVYRFKLSGDFENSIKVDVDYKNNKHGEMYEGVYTNLRVKECSPVTVKESIRMFMRSPVGGLRVLTLIHKQALRLYFKGAKFYKPTVNLANVVS